MGVKKIKFLIHFHSVVYKISLDKGFQILSKKSYSIRFDPLFAKKRSKTGIIVYFECFRPFFGQRRGQMLSYLNFEVHPKIHTTRHLNRVIHLPHIGYQTLHIQPTEKTESHVL